MAEAAFVLGQRARDRFSGVEGTIYMVETCLARTTRYYLLRDGVDSDGALWPELWLFEGRLEAVTP